ncbi:MAG: glutathione S-transferase [Dinoroseobacter sp.]|nr:glutathione S-transferase [Dinoroseobacter sp.]
MADYTLFYWPIPFRGQFIRSVLAHVGASWTEADTTDLVHLKSSDPAQQAVPFMGPPVLTDHAAGTSLAQTQAILTYLGGKHGLIPDDLLQAALTHKVIADANDVLYEMTLHNGAQMWTATSWTAFQPRLERWMAIFEALGSENDLSAEKGFILGTEAPSLADLVTYSLWGVMTAQLSPLRSVLDRAAPSISGLVDRIGALPAQKALWHQSQEQYGDAWCGGQIEASLRAVI